VLPFLLVKRYAFDLEFLAVARAFGFDRIEEMPIRLDYRFTGSGVRSRAVLRALIDTAAIFYRIRILRYYQRRRAIAGAYGWTRPRREKPLVTVLVSSGSYFRERDYPAVEIIQLNDDSSEDDLFDAACSALGEIVAILEVGARAPGNWLSACVPFFARREIGAVVTPKMAPLEGSLRSQAAAAVDESRIGAGLGYMRSTPGNVRFVDDYPASSVVVRRDAFIAAGQVPLHELVGALADVNMRTIYTPEAVIVSDPPPLFADHLRLVRTGARRRGVGFRHRPRMGLLPIAAIGLLVLAGVSFSDTWIDFLAIAALGYVALLTIAAGAAALRFQSVRVGLLTPFGIALTHIVYATGFVQGLVGG
jgi:hypothetical protein